MCRKLRPNLENEIAWRIEDGMTDPHASLIRRQPRLWAYLPDIYPSIQMCLIQLTTEIG
jgi:hypothetical protein